MGKIGDHFVTCGQMKILERRADENGLSYYQMMENAGTAAAEKIMERAAYRMALREDRTVAYVVQPKVAEGDETDTGVAIRDSNNMASKTDIVAPKPKPVHIFCGKGNNGGDGFVVARLMKDAGFQVKVILVDGEPKTEDAITNFGFLEQRDIPVLDMKADDRALLSLKGTPDIIVDAIYGTGFKGRLSGRGLQAAMYINRYSNEAETDPEISTMVAALDIPSGLGGDMTSEKELGENCVIADFTITFHGQKPIHLQSFARKYCGDIYVADIGIDEEKLWNLHG